MKDHKRELLEQVEYAKKLSEALPPVKSLVDGVLAGLRQQEAERVGKLFSEVKESPCVGCGKCCAHGNQNGYFSRTPSDLHEDFLSGKADITSFMVPHKYPLSRCSFLASIGGCTLPRKYRSTTCLKYVCSDLRRALGVEGNPNKDLIFGSGSHPQSRTLLQVRMVRQKLRGQH